MSFPGLKAFQYSEVAGILPQYKKDIVESKTNQAKVNLKKWGVSEKGAAKETTNYWLIAVAIGAILCLAGIFLTLAAHQVLPHGVNAISDLGIWGQAIGYGGLGIGIIVAIVGAVKWYLRKENASVEQSEPDVSATHYNAEVAEMDSYFPQRIKADELFAVDNPLRQEITIYYSEWDDEAKAALPGAPKTFEYKDTTPKEAFQKWSKDHAELIQGKTFINLDVLHQRTEAFEQKRVGNNELKDNTNQGNVKDTAITDAALAEPKKEQPKDATDQSVKDNPKTSTGSAKPKKSQIPKNPSSTSQNVQDPTKTNVSSTATSATLGPLPQINSKIKISNDLEMNISSKEIILICGSKGNLGAATGDEVCTRELAFLLQKNSALVEEVMKCENSQDALKALAEAIRKELPPTRVAGLCIIDGIHKTCSAEIFGNAKLRVWTQPFGAEGICEHEPGRCSHGRPSFKLQLLTLTIYTEQEYEGRRSFFTSAKADGKFFDKRYHGALPDHHWVQLKTLEGSNSVQCPHPDHINKKSSEI